MPTSFLSIAGIPASQQVTEIGRFLVLHQPQDSGIQKPAPSLTASQTDFTDRPQPARERLRQPQPEPQLAMHWRAKDWENSLTSLSFYF
jgi:hypothetical protein